MQENVYDSHVYWLYSPSKPKSLSEYWKPIFTDNGTSSTRNLPVSVKSAGFIIGYGVHRARVRSARSSLVIFLRSMVESLLVESPLCVYLS